MSIVVNRPLILLEISNSIYLLALAGIYIPMSHTHTQPQTHNASIIAFEIVCLLQTTEMNTEGQNSTAISNRTRTKLDRSGTDYI